MSNITSTTTEAINRIDSVLTMDWGSYSLVALLGLSLYKSAVMFAAYRKNNAQGDSEATDRWDNELFSRAIIPLYLRLERNIVEVLVEEGEEEPSFDHRMIEVKRNVLERTGIQGYSGIVDFHDALDEIHSNKSRSTSLKKRHGKNRVILVLIMAISVVSLIDLIYLILTNPSTILLLILGTLVSFLFILWGMFWYNQSCIDSLQYDKQ